jgi:hypothetical protein
MKKLIFNKKGRYNFHTITESLCKIMCNVYDNGKRYSPSSRYNYYFADYKQNKSGFSFGTAKACIQSYLIDNNKTNKNFDIN